MVNWSMCVKKATNGMPERRQAGSISRTLLLPCEYRGTIRLRHQLAEDGCKESQVALAKSILTSPISNFEERNLNAQWAVYWLLKAANKGQEEAISLLKDCADSGLGINTINSVEVEKCLKYSEGEKISRRVAFAVFRAIMSDTEDLIPEESFREKIERILQEENIEQIPKISDDEVSLQEPVMPRSVDDTSFRSQAHVSFSEVVNSVQSCLEGNVPLVSLKQVAQYNEYKKWLTTKYICLLWNIIIRSLENLVQCLSSVVILLSVLLLCLFLEVTTNLSTPGTETNLLMNNCKIFFATFLCLLAMLSSTCFVLCINFGGDNVKKWLHLIKFFEPNVKSEEVERKYLMKTTFPLVMFLFISLMYLILLPLNSIPTAFSDIGVLSFFLMLLADRTITRQRYHVNVSLALNILTCLYKTNIFQRFSFSSLSFLDFNVVYELGKNFHIHLNFISCLALPFVLPYLYTKMALGSERKGWHLVLLPHLMSVTWMNLACIHLAKSDNTQILFSVFSWLVILLVSRYLGVVLTFTLYLLIKLILTSGYVNFEIFLILPVFGILYILSLFFVRKFNLSHDNKIFSFLICLSVLALSYQVARPPSSPIDDSSAILSWDKYQTYCHHHAWYRTNTAEVQISCLPLKGRKVSAEGTVTSVDVIHVKNSIQAFANVLPNPVHDWFVCAFGRKYVSCDAENITPFEKEHCKLYETLNMKECHLHNWDEYKYQIIIEVSSRTSPEIIVLVDHICSSFVRGLKEGDSLQIVGTLDSNIGGSLPKFILQKAECSSCYTNTKCYTSTIVPQPDYSLSLKNIVWFYFSPFIQYK